MWNKAAQIMEMKINTDNRTVMVVNEKLNNTRKKTKLQRPTTYENLGSKISHDATNKIILL